MIVDYPVTLVRFANLDANMQLAEIQKDNIIQSIRLAFPRLSLLVEETSREVDETKSADFTNEQGIVLTCEACPLPRDRFFSTSSDNSVANSSQVRNDFVQLAPETVVRKITLPQSGKNPPDIENKLQGSEEQERSKNYQLSFQVYLNLDKTIKSTWRVNVDFSPVRFTVATARHLANGTIIDSHSRKILRCFSNTDCKGESHFATYAAANDFFEEKIKGRKARNAMRINETISLNNTIAPITVKSGQEVDVIYQFADSGITLQTKGNALQSAGTDELVEVRVNPIVLPNVQNSGLLFGGWRSKTIRGVVGANGKVYYAQ